MSTSQRHEIAAKRPETEQARYFALLLPIVLGLAAAMLYFGFWFWPQRPRLSLAFLIAAPAVNAFALLLPRVWLSVFRTWMRLASGLSWISTRVLLVMFFGLVFTPIGLIMRIFRKRPLDLVFRDGRPTYWIDKKEQDNNLERYFRQF